VTFIHAFLLALNPLNCCFQRNPKNALVSLVHAGKMEFNWGVHIMHCGGDHENLTSLEEESHNLP